MKKLLLFTLLILFTSGIYAQCYTDITFGGAHTTAKKSDGTIWGWGAASYGNLTTTNQVEPNPVQLGTATDWNFIKNGAANSFAIKNNGTLWGCGSNQLGSLGVNSNTQNFTTFQQITTATNWIKISPSSFFTLALKADGTIWAWGQNNQYQLGNSPATAQQLSPLQIGTATDWVDIESSAGGDTGFAIKANGTIWGWGANAGYMLYFGSSVTSISTPTQINSSTNWVKMTVGASHILAQKSDGTLWSWGSGNSGALGNGSILSTTTEQQITNDLWLNFAAGTNTSFGIKNDGTLWAWGKNTNGQLGDGTSTNRLVPTQIGTDTNWLQVENRGGLTTMATKTDGTVWYWGRNYYGEFGNGNSYMNIYYNSPQQSTAVCVAALATPSFEKKEVIILSPNPAKDFVTLHYAFSSASNATVVVYDISGRKISEKSLSSLSGEIQLNTSTYAAGLYMVVVKQDGVLLAQKKLVIE